jgi:predicted house-cleaning noncanonical NTP pyrophosphatase (MazG superfamily)
MSGAEEKLIRDGIPEIAERNGDKISVRTADIREMPGLTRMKLLEEFDEVMFAPSHELLEELADLIEVAYALAQAHGHAAETLDAKRREKAAKRGRFDRRFVMKLP